MCGGRRLRNWSLYRGGLVAEVLLVWWKEVEELVSLGKPCPLE